RPDNSDSNVYQPPFNRFTVALTAASPGSLGGLRGLGQLREVMTNLGSLVIPQQLAIGAAYEAFNEEGKLVNQETVDRLTGLVKTLLETDQRLQK
ncbi:NADPH-dependent FMN reductase, partial [Oleiphilus sp. HI0117]